MQLKDILKDLNADKITGNINLNISGIAYNSTNVKDNYVFVAIDGFRDDGHRFINDAINKGAKAIVISKDIDNSPDATIIKVKDTRAALSKLAANFFGHQSKYLKVIGVTGTNGKTTTTYFIKSILESSKLKASLIGTIETCINGHCFSSSHTTPESLELQEMFKAMVKQKIDTCVMEVSSHSIHLSRINDCDFDINVFTNLTHEHLDFHKSMENYYKIKKQLFFKTKNFNIVNSDDFYGDRLAKEIKHLGARLLTYGIEKKPDIYADKVILSEKGSSFKLNTPNGGINIKINIPGVYNIYNSLAAAACGYALNINLETIKEGLESVNSIPGRFEFIPTNKNLNIIIDYAHTPDGFEKLLGTLDRFNQGRKILVFGCVGERDRSKRSIMGEIAEKYCDLCVLTTDNCRSEDPMEIINDIKQGLKKNKQSYVVIPDRAQAIRHSIINSKDNDTIIITGKGHEKRQIIGEQEIFFDERQIIAQALEESDCTLITLF